MNEITWYSGENKEMQLAISKTQEVLPEYLNILDEDSKRVLSALEVSIVKYAIKSKDKRVGYEHVFMDQIELDSGKVYGTLNSQPEYNDDFEEGQRIEIDIRYISDFIYVIGGNPQGGFTFKVMWNHFTKEEKLAYKGHPPFSWLKLN